MSASRSEEVRAGIPKYIALNRANPEQYPLNVLGFAKWIGASRQTVYNADPDVAEHLTSPSRTEPAGIPALVLTPEDSGASTLSDVGLAEEIRRALSRATWPMQSFVGSQKRAESIAETAHLGLADLDKLIGTLQSVRRDLAPLVEELRRRQRRQRSTEPERPPEQADLL